MPDRSNQFPHLSLRLVKEGIASAPPGGGGRVSAITLANRGDAGGHGSKLKSSVDLITTNWKEEKKKRKEEGKPELPDAVSFILQVDPDLFDADALKSFGIEVVADLEHGYIIGASADTELSELRKKIEQFIKSQRGGGKVPEIWEILEGTRRPEYILSDGLKAEWNQILEQQEYIVDIGISCINIQEQYSRCPKRKESESDERYQNRVDQWLDKHNLSPEDWDDLYSERTDKLQEFINQYNGEILRNVAGDEIGTSRLPDCFSCRIRILGKGLKDLVLNFPYIFDVSEPDEFSAPSVTPNESDSDREIFTLEAPDPNAPKVCVIDSGIQELHPKLRGAIDSQHSRSWVPGELDMTADYVQGGGHGTRVAGAILYPRGIPSTGFQKATCWVQNARILDGGNQLPKKLFPPKVLEEIVEFYHYQTRTRIFNHSVAGISPCRTQSMTPWAAAIDKLTWEKQGDFLFIVAAGNIEANVSFVTRPSISAHMQAARVYPDYLLSPSARVANPAQSFQALTVGSVSHSSYQNPPFKSIAEADYPSSFSCSGLGIWDTIKPEVVEYGGDYVIDSSTSPSFTKPPSVCPELVRSTLDGGKAVSADAVGTSFAAPKVAHIAAALAAAFPQESALFYRALIIQSARLPNWTNESVEKLYQGVRTMGYGIPSLGRALGNSANRVTLTTQGNERICARQAKVYQVQIPETLLRQGEGFDILIEITLSYVAEPRRTRRHRRKYLSTWLDWTCSKKGEDPQKFLDRVLKKYNEAPQDADEGEGLFRWTLGKRQFRPNSDDQRRPRGIDGIVKEISRSTGTVQKDWAKVQSYDLREGFCIAVVGHEGWNKSSEATAPYSLVVSFEAVNSEISIYDAFIQVQQPLQVQQEVQMTIS
ncbi:S8 family peptidase [Anthocerotibacter panamensis]|uniref:S8 family peptidase n=1 Tax=Anthocerotibacter panamensis TaxID=2857077 RepID=UPI001C40565F|nr:S8 family peptidase [Anthocerotibacter panamensis]